MAIRERKGRAKPWQVYWNNPYTGKRECLNFATKEEALKEDSLVKHRLKFERESFKKEDKDNEKNETEITLEQAYLLYLREKQFSKKSLRWQLGAMRLPLKMFGHIELAKLHYDDIVHIMSEFENMLVKQVTVRGRMSVLRTVLRWSAEKGFCQPIRFPKLPPAHYDKFIPPTTAELQKLLAVAPQHIQRVIILGSQCGLRVGPCELLQLKWSDINLEAGIIRIKGSKKNLSMPWREVPIISSMLPVFQTWFQSDMAEGIEYVIHYAGRKVESIKRSWQTTLRNAGITRRIRPYDLRHAFATELIANGVDIGTVAKLMGHNSPVMILNHYQHVMDKQKKAAIESLPDLQYVSKPCAQNEERIMKNS